ncbi:MAG: hypothetical protein AAF215_10645 [Cyanobacteria bacterium P01_A01_bin.123]
MMTYRLHSCGELATISNKEVSDSSNDYATLSLGTCQAVWPPNLPTFVKYQCPR